MKRSANQHNSPAQPAAPTGAPAPDIHPDDITHQPRRWLVLLAMTGSLSMIFVDMTVVGIALPSIGQSLDMGVQGQAWVLSAYLLALASLVAIGGRLSDLTGKVPAFIAGVIGFAGASVLCGVAADGTQLITGRVLQGLAACLMQPAASALVVGSFAPGERGKAMAVFVGIPLLFMALGPALGGVVVQHAGWRWVFYLNIPVALAAVGLTLVARPHDARTQDRAIDWTGAALLLLGLPLFVVGLQELGTLARADARVDAWVPAALVVGGAFLAIFLRRQWSSPRPLLRLRFFQDRALRGNALVIACMQFAMTGFVIQGSIYAQDVLGYTPTQAGLSLLPLLVPVVLMVHVAGRWYDRAGVRQPVVVGTLLATVGQLVQALGGWMQAYPVMAAGMAIMGTGIALTMSPSNTDALSRVGAADRGQVSGLVQTLRQVGGTTGVAAIAATVIFAQSLHAAGGAGAGEAGEAGGAQARTVLAHSMAAGGLTAALATAAACVVAVRLLPVGQPTRPAARIPRSPGSSHSPSSSPRRR